MEGCCSQMEEASVHTCLPSWLMPPRSLLCSLQQWASPLLSCTFLLILMCGDTPRQNKQGQQKAVRKAKTPSGPWSQRSWPSPHGSLWGFYRVTLPHIYSRDSCFNTGSRGQKACCPISIVLTGFFELRSDIPLNQERPSFWYRCPEAISVSLVLGLA